MNTPRWTVVETAQLGLDAESAGLRRAAGDLDNLGDAAERAEMSFEDLAAAMRRVDTPMRGAVSPMRTYAGGMERIKKSLSSHDFRNAAFQFNQVGQSIAATGQPIRSLAIQLPDLLLSFGTMGIIVGALVGALAPLALDLIRASDNAGALKDSVDALSKSMAEYKKVAADAASSTSDLRERFGSQAESIRPTLQLQEQLQMQEHLKATQEAAGGVASAYDEMFRAVDEMASAQQAISGIEGGAAFVSQADVRYLEETRRNVASLAGQMRLSVDQALELDQAIDSIAEASTVDEILSAMGEFESLMLRVYGATGKIPLELQNVLSMAVAARIETAEFAAAMERVANAPDARAIEIFSSQIESAIEGAETYREMSDELREQITLQAAIAEHGRDSAEVAALRADAERDAYRELVDSLDVSQAMKDELMASHAHAQALADTNMAAGIRAAASEAASLAEWLNISLSRALAISTLTPAMRDEDLAMSQDVLPDSGQRAQNRSAVENISSILERNAKAAKSGSGGGGVSEAERELEKFTRTLESFRTEEQQAQAQLDELQASFARFGDQLDPNGEHVELYTQAIEELRNKLAETGEEGEGFFDIIESNMPRLSDLFRDGTSAIQDMARSMVDMAWQVNVLEPFFKMMREGGFGGGGGGGGGGGWLGNLLGNLFPSAEGNAFYGGNVVPFARGGIVDSPTIFPMAKGMGLMGEAGPEAVMPLRRGEGGRLGVEAAAPVVNVQVIENATDGPTRVEQNGPDIKVLLRKVAIEAITGPDGKKAMGRTFGLKTKAWG